jgi:hypothetical protein
MAPTKLSPGVPGRNLFSPPNGFGRPAHAHRVLVLHRRAECAIDSPWTRRASLELDLSILAINGAS